VLDPFNGTGTTGEVAISNDQNYVGIELNKEYLEIARERLDSGDNCFSQEVFTIEDILK
jgi:DNA modification methylase